MAQSTSGDGDDSAQEARMKFIATVIRARDLKPGELFSVCGQAYWDGVRERGSIGEKVYIRTAEPADSAPDPDKVVYRITAGR